MILCALNITFTFANEKGSNPLTLSEFLKLVEEYNPSLKLEKMYFDLTKKQLNAARSKYDIKYHLKGDISHTVDGSNQNNTGYYWYRNNDINYKLSFLSKKFLSGGKLDLSLSGRNINDKDDSSNFRDIYTLGSQDTSQTHRLTLRFDKPLIRNFMGLNPRQFNLYKKELNYKTAELRFIQFKNNIMYEAVMSFIGYSYFVKKKEIKQKTIDYLSRIIEEIEKAPPYTQSKPDLISLKIRLNETIDALYRLESNILDQQYELLNLINHTKISDLNFGLFSKKTNSILKKETTAFAQLNKDHNLKLQKIDIKQQKLKLKAQKNESLPKLDLFTDVSYYNFKKTYSESSQSKLFKQPRYALGLNFIMPIGDKELSLLEDIAQIKFEIKKLSLNHNNNKLTNETDQLLDKLAIYNNKIAKLKQLAPLYEEKIELEIQAFQSNLSSNPSNLNLYLSKTTMLTNSLEKLERSHNKYLQNIYSYFQIYYQLKYMSY